MGLRESWRRKRKAVTGNADPRKLFVLGLLREIRAEAQNLQRSLQAIEKGLELVDPQVQAKELNAALLDSKTVFDYNKGQIVALLDKLRKSLDAAPNLLDWCGDEVVHIENHWDRATNKWPEAGQTVDEIRRRILLVKQSLHDIIFICVRLTVYARLNQHLKSLRTGQPLDFHGTFNDELEDKEDRVKILRRLRSHPESVQGIVDVENGLVFRVSPSLSRRRVSYVIIVAAFLLGGLVAFALSQLGSWLSLSGWPFTPARATELVVGYYFLMIGGLAHIGIDALKETRAKKGPAFTALEDIFLWIHVKEVSILGGVFSLWFGWLTLAFLLPTLEWQVAFFAGYSIDSVVDLGLQRFASAVPTRIEALRQQLA